MRLDVIVRELHEEIDALEQETTDPRRRGIIKRDHDAIRREPHRIWWQLREREKELKALIAWINPTRR